MPGEEQADYFNVSYGVASAAITTGSVAITTTEAAFYGMDIAAGATAKAVVLVYDSLGAGGNILANITVGSDDSKPIDRRNPIMAKIGIYVVATGTGMTGSLFYGPKG